jgi:hypothetical protein
MSQIDVVVITLLLINTRLRRECEYSGGFTNRELPHQASRPILQAKWSEERIVCNLFIE